MLLNAHVEGIELEGGRAAGVRLRGGARIRARRAVVSNASMWDTQVWPNLMSTGQFYAAGGMVALTLCTHAMTPLVTLHCCKW